jgi:hypothetical protein
MAMLINPGIGSRIYKRPPHLPQKQRAPSGFSGKLNSRMLASPDVIENCDAARKPALKTAAPEARRQLRQ